MQSPSWNDRSRPAWRRLTLGAVGVAVALTSVGCASSDVTVPSRPAAQQIPTPTVLFGVDRLTAPPTTSKAVTYDPQAPVGATVAATLIAIPLPNGSTQAQLTVFGLQPNRGYAAHAHTNACGATGADAGPHFQHIISSDPQYANPSNEIWLDVHTNAAGAGTSRTTVSFVFADRAPGSIVIHGDMQTSPGGKAGARIACLTLSGW
jgi:superoxide dismutase, Cu-Zn family